LNIQYPTRNIQPKKEGKNENSIDTAKKKKINKALRNLDIHTDVTRSAIGYSLLDIGYLVLR